jgi:hypothetical protein
VIARCFLFCFVFLVGSLKAWIVVCQIQVSGYGTVVVGHGMVKTVPLFGGSGSSNGRRRRLLQEQATPGEGAAAHRQEMRQDVASFGEDGAWSHVAKPCRTLVQQLQLSDEPGPDDAAGGSPGTLNSSYSSSNGTTGDEEPARRDHSTPPAGVPPLLLWSVLDVQKLQSCIHWRKVS